MWIRVGDKIINTDLVTDVVYEAGNEKEESLLLISQATTESELIGTTVHKAMIRFDGAAADAVFEFFDRMATTIYPVTPESVYSCMVCGWYGPYSETSARTDETRTCPRCMSGVHPSIKEPS
jgi:hypothetical protein